MYDDKQKSNTKNEEIEEIIKPSYYTVMPAVVRYDDRLKANEKILYSEIVTLASKNGYCYASNKYLSEIYGVSIVSISNWINRLIDLGYVKNENEFLNDTGYIVKRKLFPVVGPDILNKSLICDKQNFKDDKENFKRHIKQNFKDNNTSINTINNNNIYSREDGKNKEIIISVINYLNEKADKSYKSTTQKTKSLINARIKEGFTLDDFKKVIDTKTAQWKNDDYWNKFLRPGTLFSNNFESYLQENNSKSGSMTNYSNKRNQPNIKNELKKYDR